MSITKEMNAAMEKINKQPEAIKRLLMDCSDYYMRIVEAATDLELESAVKIGRKYLTGNEVRSLAMEVRLLAMEEELEKRQEKRKSQEQDQKNCKVDMHVDFEVKNGVVERNRRKA